MKNIILTLTLLISVNIDAFTQVGIGNATPNAGSILDLTNGNDKALLLPLASQDPSAIITFNIPTSAGMLFYYADKLFLRTSSGINALSPWLFDGSLTGVISSGAGIPVGIGINPITSSPAVLTVADAALDVTAAGSNASIVVGSANFTTPHLMVDEDEIMAKTNATTAGLLKFQEEGGTAQVRSAGADAGVVTVLTAYGSMDAKGKIKENGNDLLPVGAIIMWNGTTVPAGWALCDGGTYALDAGGTITTPNLMDRFIVGADATNGNGVAVGTYAYTNTGGATSTILNTANLPSHDHTINHGHTVTDPTHSHTLNMGDDNGSGVPDDATGTNGGSYTTVSAATGLTVDNHTGNSGNTGSGTPFENRPPYFALAYIMKL